MWVIDYEKYPPLSLESQGSRTEEVVFYQRICTLVQRWELMTLLFNTWISSTCHLLFLAYSCFAHLHHDKYHWPWPIETPTEPLLQEAVPAPLSLVIRPENSSKRPCLMITTLIFCIGSAHLTYFLTWLKGIPTIMVILFSGFVHVGTGKQQRFHRGSGSDPFGDLTLWLIQPFWK
jgi:hypothetical protein